MSLLCVELGTDDILVGLVKLALALQVYSVKKSLESGVKR